MVETTSKSKLTISCTGSAVLAFVLVAAVSVFAGGDKKKKKNEAPPPPPPSILQKLDYSKIVWPNPPEITRLKYLDYFVGEKAPEAKAETQKKKSEWMARLAGGEAESAGKHAPKPRYTFWTPYGMGVDSKGKLYIADGKVGGVFIIDPNTRDVEMIKNGVQAHFGLIMGIAIDDTDRLFVSDSQLHRVLVFGPDRKLQGTISGTPDPGGLAVDNENRFLYVADPSLDQVLVYDADKLNLIRKIGTAGKDHTLSEPGQLARPTNVAVDADGNVYISDTSNRRIQVFDADGQFITGFGKAGDGPGKFARPKGIAIDSDGHVWVADAQQDRVQVFSKEGRLLMYLGGHGVLPGQFADLAGLTIDKKTNRVFTSEQYPGRVQMFQYITNPEARAEFERRQNAGKTSTGANATASQAPAGTTEKPKEQSSVPR